MAEFIDYDIMLRGGDDAFLFLPGNTGQGAAELFGFTVADFDNYQDVFFLHHQIQFAGLAAVIAAQQLQTLFSEMIQGQLFRVFALLQMRRFILAEYHFRLFDKAGRDRRPALELRAYQFAGDAVFAGQGQPAGGAGKAGGFQLIQFI